MSLDTSDISVQKVALVTGGAIRLGRQICLALHEEGFNIAIHCNNSIKKAEELKDELHKVRSSSAIVIRSNLGENVEENTRNIIQSVIKKWGRLDVLVNNASVFMRENLAATTSQIWDEVINVNLKAPVFLMKMAAPFLKITKGNIVNMADLIGQMGSPTHFAHVASKGGLESATKSAAVELAPEIRVNAIAPGCVGIPDSDPDFFNNDFMKCYTESTPLKRIGTAQDVAKTVLFLINTDYITAETITLDGGIRQSWQGNIIERTKK